ncbi:MAG TPA: glycosyltransferase [Bryobacteraceae bacterium]|jgi:glycosyltransferase involved in cell wall biosynthesis
MNNDTPYRKIWIDVDKPVPRVDIPAGHYGIGVFLRRKGEPIGYFRHAAAPGTALNAAQLSEIIAAKAGADIVRSGLRRPRPVRGEEPRVTVAICTKDRAWSLETCLKSLIPLQFSDGGGKPRFEILVVDNAPSDSSTQDLVRVERAIRYIVEPKPGLDFARNVALRQASGDYVAFLDDDVAVDPAWFSGLVQAIAENPEVGCITGPVMPMELETRAQVLFEERGGFNRGFGTVRHTQYAISKLTHPCNAGNFGAGCNMVLRRELLRRIGLFDEALDTGAPLPGGGDLDVFYRVLRADAPLVYAGNMAVYHRHRKDYKGLRRQMWTWGLGFMAFTMKSYRHDPENRYKLRMAIIGSLSFFLRMTVLTGLGRWEHEWTSGLAAWEFAGAMAGIAGEYGRSQKRIAEIRAREAC